MKQLILISLLFVGALNVFAAEKEDRINCLGRDENGTLMLSILQKAFGTEKKYEIDILLVPHDMSLEDAVKNGGGFTYEYVSYEVINGLPTFIIKEEEGIELFRVIKETVTDGSDKTWSGTFLIDGGYSIAIDCGDPNS